MKALVESGAAGEVRHVSVTLTQRPGTYEPANLPWRVIPAIAGGGLFVDLAAHTLDFLDFVLGPIRQAHGYAAHQGRQYPAEDLVSGSFVFESGVQGVGTWCFTAAEEIDQVEIAGTRGKVVFSTFGHAPVRLVTPDGVQEFHLDHPPHIQQPLIQLVVDDLNGVGRCPSTGVTGARTSWVMDRLLGRETP